MDSEVMVQAVTALKQNSSPLFRLCNPDTERGTGRLLACKKQRDPRMMTHQEKMAALWQKIITHFSLCGQQLLLNSNATELRAREEWQA